MSEQATELRDARAVPMLITVLEDEDEGVRGEAHRTLVALTKQDFGDQRKRRTHQGFLQVAVVIAAFAAAAATRLLG